jgi:hypothetical protein
MNEYNDTEEAKSEEPTVEQGALDTSEEGFMKGYMDDDDGKECAECGDAIRTDFVEKAIDGEKHIFCTELCAQEFEEGIQE